MNSYIKMKLKPSRYKVYIQTIISYVYIRYRKMCPFVYCMFLQTHCVLCLLLMNFVHVYTVVLVIGVNLSKYVITPVLLLNVDR